MLTKFKKTEVPELKNKRDRNHTQAKTKMTRVMSIRFTEEQHKMIAADAQSCASSFGEVVRRRSTNKTDPPKVIPEINRQIYLELCRIGNNLNQYIKLIHQGKSTGTDPILLRDLYKTVQTMGLQLAQK